MKKKPLPFLPVEQIVANLHAAIRGDSANKVPIPFDEFSSGVRVGGAVEGATGIREVVGPASADGAFEAEQEDLFVDVACSVCKATGVFMGNRCLLCKAQGEIV